MSANYKELGFEEAAGQRTNLADVLTEATVATEGLIPGQTPMRITNDKMRSWKTIQGVPVDNKSPRPKDRGNFFFVEPKRVKEVIKKQWQNYFQKPGRYGLSEESTIEDAVNTFDQENPQNKLKYLQQQGINPKEKIKDAKQRFDLGALNPFGAKEADAEEIPQSDDTEFGYLGFEETQAAAPTKPLKTDYEEFGFEAEKPTAGRFMANMKESFQRGEIAANIDQAAFMALTGKLDYDKDVRPLKEHQKKVEGSDPIKGGNIISQAAYDVSAMLPAMGSGIAQGAGAGAIAGGAAAASGVGAPAALPMFVAGEVAGSLNYWYQQGAGSLYGDLWEENVPDNIAKPTAHIAGALYGAVEFSQVDKLIPGAKKMTRILLKDTVKKIAARMAALYGATWAQEVGEEGMQEVIMSAAKETASKAAGTSDKSNGQILSKVMLDGWEAVKESALPMMFLLGPRAATDVAGVVKQKGEGKKQETPEDKIKGQIGKEMVKRALEGMQLGKEPVSENAKQTQPSEDLQGKVALNPDGQPIEINAEVEKVGGGEVTEISTPAVSTEGTGPETAPVSADEIMQSDTMQTLRQEMKTAKTADERKIILKKIKQEVLTQKKQRKKAAVSANLVAKKAARKGLPAGSRMTAVEAEKLEKQRQEELQQYLVERDAREKERMKRVTEKDLLTKASKVYQKHFDIFQDKLQPRISLDTWKETYQEQIDDPERFGKVDEVENELGLEIGDRIEIKAEVGERIIKGTVNSVSKNDNKGEVEINYSSEGAYGGWVPISRVVKKTGTIFDEGVEEAARKDFDALQQEKTNEITKIKDQIKSLQGMSKRLASDNIRLKNLKKELSEKEGGQKEKVSKTDTDQHKAEIQKAIESAGSEAAPAIQREGEKPAIERAREALVLKTLNKKVNYGDDIGIKTKKDFLDTLAAQGAKVEEVQVEAPGVKQKMQEEIDLLRKNAPTGNENHPETRRLRELQKLVKDGVTKTEYRVIRKDGSLWVISKTEFDYFKSKRPVSVSASKSDNEIEDRVRKGLEGTFMPDKLDNPIDQAIVEAFKDRKAEITRLTKAAEKYRAEGKEELAQIAEGQIRDYKSVEEWEFIQDFQANPDYYMKSNVDPFLRFKNRAVNRASPDDKRSIEEIKKDAEKRKAESKTFSPIEMIKGLGLNQKEYAEKIRKLKEEYFAPGATQERKREIAHRTSELGFLVHSPALPEDIYDSIMTEGFTKPLPGAKQKATFKISKKASIWDRPYGGDIQKGDIKTGKFGRSSRPTRKITAEKVQQIYQDTLKDIEFTEDDEFVIITGTPKTEAEMSAKERKMMEGINEPSPAYGPQFVSPFSSKMEDVLANTPAGGFKSDQLLNMFKNAGIKQEEIEFTGIQEFLKGKDRVSKQEVMDFIEKNKVKVEVVVKGERKKDALPPGYTIKKERMEWVVRNDDGFTVAGSINSKEEALQEALKNINKNELFNTDTKFSSYTLPGGENYREVLVTLPGAKGAAKETFDVKQISRNEFIVEKNMAGEQPDQEIGPIHATAQEAHQYMAKLESGSIQQGVAFRSSHFDEPNILVHLRTTDRKTADGKKMLFVEEIQSDWHAKGKRSGYGGDFEKASQAAADYLDTLYKKYNEPGNMQKVLDRLATKEERNEYYRLNELANKAGASVPNAPFKNTWHELALKQAIDMAVKEGYDGVSFISGQQTADRYDLSKQVNSISWGLVDAFGSHKDITIDAKAGKSIGLSINKDGKVVSTSKHGENLMNKPIDEVVGKDLAAKIIKANEGELSGLDLKVGGEWAKKFYDEILPSSAQKYIKKWGGKVEDVRIVEGMDQYNPRDFSVQRNLDDNYAIVEVNNGEVIDIFPTHEEAQDAIEAGLKDYRINTASKLLPQKGFLITPAMREEVQAKGQFLFEKQPEFDKAPEKGDTRSEQEIAHGSKEQAEKDLQSALNTIADVRRNAASAIRERNEIAKELESRGYINHIGKEVKDAYDAAELATVFRHPKMEQLQVIFVKRGKVQSHQVFTSKIANTVKVDSDFNKRLVKLAERLQSDEVYLAHNHPSGDPTPSSTDIFFTQQMAKNLTPNNFNKSTLSGHIVTNGDHWSHISPDGKISSKIAYKTPQRQFPKLEGEISAPETVAKTGRAFIKTDKVAVIFVDSKLKVAAIENIGSDKNIAQYVRQMMPHYGVSYYFVVFNAGDRPMNVVAGQMPPGMVDLVRLDFGGGFSSLKEGHMGAKNLLSFDVTEPGVRAQIKSYRVQEPLAQYGGFSDPEIEARFKNANGVQKPQTLQQKVMAGLDELFRRATRVYPDLPNDPRFAGLRNILNKQKIAMGVAKDRAVRNLKVITQGLDSTKLDIFTRKIILDDLAQEHAAGRALPFGYSQTVNGEVNTNEAALKKDLETINFMVEAEPAVKQAIELRNQIWEGITSDLVTAGILKESQLRENYFRHQVLMYANMKGVYGTGKRMKKPTPGYAKKRRGSTHDINSNYTEAEFEVMAQSLMDIETSKQIQAIENSPLNIVKSLKDQAAQLSEETGEEVKWQSLIPEGYTTWQPDRGNVFYHANSLADKVVEEVLELGAAEATTEDLRAVIAMGKKKKQFVLPVEAAATLDKMYRDRNPAFIAAAVRATQGTWKHYILLNPRRAFKYNLQNFIGDFDAVIAGDPRIIKYLFKANSELIDIYYRKKEMSGPLREFFERGGIGSQMTINELPDLHNLEAFQHLQDKIKIKRDLNLFQGYWQTVGTFTSYRESILRYAAYLHYKDLYSKNDYRNIGASDRQEIMAMDDTLDRAAKVATELLGDYANITALGQEMREMVIPFYSWLEINAGRYTRLIRNNFQDSFGGGARAAGALAGLGVWKGSAFLAGFWVRMAAMTILMNLYNQLLFPDEEEEISEYDKNRTHLILGRDKNGNIRILRANTAFGDILEWFGLEASPTLWRQYSEGKMSLVDLFGNIPGTDLPAFGLNPFKGKLGLHPMATKLVRSISPLYKWPAETLTGKALPVFDDRSWVVEDKVRNIAKGLSLEHEYDLFTQNPSRGYFRSLQEAFIAVQDPQENAYRYIQGEKYRFMETVLGRGGSGDYYSKRSIAYRAYRKALRFKDVRAQKRAEQDMVDLGVKRADLEKSLAAADPLSGLSKQDKAHFINHYLSQKDRETYLKRAQTYYQQTFLNRR